MRRVMPWLGKRVPCNFEGREPAWVWDKAVLPGSCSEREIAGAKS